MDMPGGIDSSKKKDEPSCGVRTPTLWLLEQGVGTEGVATYGADAVDLSSNNRSNITLHSGFDKKATAASGCILMSIDNIVRAQNSLFGWAFALPVRLIAEMACGVTAIDAG